MSEREKREGGRGNYFKELELAHTALEAGKSEFCRTGQQARNSGKSCCSFESEFCRAAGWKLRQSLCVAGLRRVPFFSGNFRLCS